MRLFYTLLPLVCLMGCHPAREKHPDAVPPPGEIWVTTSQMQGAKVVVAEVQEENVDDLLTVGGRVTFDDARVARIFSPVNGRILRIDAELGQRVKKGAALALIESPEVGIASSDLGKAHADLIAAEHEFARQKELLASHASSQKDYEQAEDNYRKAKAEMDRARAKTALFRTGAGDAVTQGYMLRTGIEGEVISRRVSLGAEVQGMYGGGQADELFTVGELDRVWVVAEVFEMDIERVHLGSQADVHLVAYPRRTFTGKIDYISRTLDKETRTIKVRCIFENPERVLKPEMFATVELHVDEKRALAIPKDAVVRLGEQNVVFVERGEAPGGKRRFERVPVDVDEGEGSKWLPVRHGLPKGERIVTSGAVLLSGML